MSFHRDFLHLQLGKPVFKQFAGISCQYKISSNVFEVKGILFHG